MIKKDYYRILEITRTAMPEEIKKSFRRLAVRFHPDKNPGNLSAEERFKEINEAYEVLRDPKKKAAYDKVFFASNSSGPARTTKNSAGPQNTSASTPGSTSSSSSNPEDNDDGAPDIFSDIFGDLFNGKKKPSKTESTDLRYTLNLELEEAAAGAEKIISFIRKRDGRDETAKISVKVPPGVKFDHRLKLRGEGDGAESRFGDLYVIVNIKVHEFFDRDGDNLRLEVPITFKQAALGGSISIPTLTGIATLEIPPGTPSGKTFRLKNKGFPIFGQTTVGDMLVSVSIDAPLILSPTQQDLLNRFETNTSNYKIYEEFQRKLASIRKAKA